MFHASAPGAFIRQNVVFACAAWTLFGHSIIAHHCYLVLLQTWSVRWSYIVLWHSATWWHFKKSFHMVASWIAISCTVFLRETSNSTHWNNSFFLIISFQTPSGKRKRCEQELYDRLLYLLKELEPWEQKLLQAHKKARLKMRKEQENYKEPEIKVLCWPIR